jgi:hypothetical protein
MNLLRRAAALAPPLLLTAILAGPAGAEMPRGETRLWMEQRYVRYGPFGDPLTFDPLVFHADGRLVPANRGVWSFWAETADGNVELYLRADQVPTRYGRLGFQLGDLTRDRGRQDVLRREFHPTVLLRGGQVSLRRPSGLGFDLSAGTLTDSRALVSTGRINRHTPLFGFGADGPISGNWSWEARFDRQGASPEGLPGRSVAQVFTGLRRPRGWSSLGEFRLSRRDGGDWGTSVVTGVDYQEPRYAVGGHLRHLSRDFSGLGLYPDPHTNEVGGRLQASYRPASPVLTTFVADYGRDLAGRYGLPPESRFLARMYASSGFGRTFYGQVQLTYRNRSSHDPDSLLVDQHTLSGRTEFGFRTRPVSGSLAYTRGLFRSGIDGTSDWHEDRLDGRVAWHWHPRIRTELTGLYADRRFPDGAWASRERSGFLRLYWDPSWARSLWTTVGHEYQSAALTPFAREMWRVGGGWEQPLPNEFSFRFEALASLGSGGGEDVRVDFRLERRFSFGGGTTIDPGALPEFGSVSGVVFEDRNQNGVRDPGEPGIRGVPLLLGSGARVETDDDGAYSFPRAATLLDFLGLDVKRLPTRYIEPANSRVELRLDPGEETTYDFAVQRAAILGGRVLLVDETDSTVDETAGDPLADVLVRIRGTHHDVFTGADGKYVIDGIGAGHYEVELVGWSLPEHHVVVGSSVRQIRVEAGQALLLESFRIRYQPPRVLQRFEAR